MPLISTGTTTTGWPCRTRWPRCVPAPARSRNHETDSANGPENTNLITLVVAARDLYGITCKVDERALRMLSDLVAGISGVEAAAMLRWLAA